MQIKLTLATVFLALTSSTLAILPPIDNYYNPTLTRPGNNGGGIRPAVCSYNPRSPLYCGRRAGASYSKRSPEPVLMRPAVCSPNPNSPLYCPGRKTEEAPFRTQVCSSNPNSRFYCKGSQKRGLGPAPVVWRTRPDGTRFRVPIIWAGAPRPSGIFGGKRDAQFRAQVCSSNPNSPFYCKGYRSYSQKRGLGPAPSFWHTRPDGLRYRLPIQWGGAPRPGGLGGGVFGGAKRSFGAAAAGGRRGNKTKKPRMMVCSFDKKSPNYCPGLAKDAEKIDDRKGRGRGFF